MDSILGERTILFMIWIASAIALAWKPIFAIPSTISATVILVPWCTLKSIPQTFCAPSGTGSDGTRTASVASDGGPAPGPTLPSAMANSKHYSMAVLKYEQKTTRHLAPQMFTYSKTGRLLQRSSGASRKLLAHGLPGLGLPLTWARKWSAALILLEVLHHPSIFRQR